MKILILSNLFYPNEIGGYEIGCRDFTNLLNNIGHETLVATSFHENDLIDKNKSVVRIFKMFTSFDYFKKTYSYEECEKYNSKVLNKLIEDWKPQKILLWNIEGLGTKIIKDIIDLKIPFNIFAWDYTYYYYKMRLKDYFLFRFKNKISNYQYKFILQKMIFPSKYLKNFYCKNLEDKKIIYPFIDFENFQYNRNFSTKKNKLVYLGQIVDHKGIFDIIKNIDDYNKENIKKFTLTIYCQNISEDKFQYLRNYDFIDVKMDVKREQIQKELSTYDFGIFSSKWEEPFGISCLEMLAAGLIVLSTCSGGSTEMVINNNPIKFNIFKNQDFVNKLLEALKLEQNLSNWNVHGSKKFSSSSAVKNLNQIILNDN
jgi:glycogen(starch) synthase